jgi:hypothetical protein
MSGQASGASPREDTSEPLPKPGTNAAPPGKLAPPGDSNSTLTGIWLADGGGMYFLRQIDDVLWWVGLSGGLLYPGLEYCNVYHASITGTTINGEWSDVPRGTTANHGNLDLRLIDDNRLLKESETGGFSASTWWRTESLPWPTISAAESFEHTLKNVVKNGHWSEKSTLADNLQALKDSVSVFAYITRAADHLTEPVTVGYPVDIQSPEQGFSYSDFICLNDGSIKLGFEDQDDGDVTFWLLIYIDQILGSQPNFFMGIETRRDYILGKLNDLVEGETIMFGRSADCGDDDAEASPPLFPGWAERPSGSVLFNGRPVRVIIPSPLGGGQPEQNFLTEISFDDPVRVTGALVFDEGHPDEYPDKLEIHPVYSIDRLTTENSGDLSGAWADDVGNTYYLRHNLADNTVWYVGLSPLGPDAFGQVFRGVFHPAPKVLDDSAAPESIGTSPVPPQDALTGNVVAISLGFGTAPPFEASRTRIGDTGAVTMLLGRADIVGKNVPALSIGDFRLMKLYDA